MAKIAMIGAGGLIFGKTLMSDFLATPALCGVNTAWWRGPTDGWTRCMRLCSA